MDFSFFIENKWVLLSLLACAINTPLGIYQYAASWYINLGLAMLNMGIYFEHMDYAQCIVRGAALFANLYGIYKWSILEKGKQKVSLPITKTSLDTWWRLGGATLLLSILFYLALVYLTPEMQALGKKIPPRPSLSGPFSAIMLAGMWLTANKKLESQLYWFCYNLVAIPYHAQELGTLLWVKHFFLLFTCLYGYKVWRKSFDNQVGKPDKIQGRAGAFRAIEGPDSVAASTQGASEQSVAGRSIVA